MLLVPLVLLVLLSSPSLSFLSPGRRPLRFVPAVFISVSEHVRKHAHTCTNTHVFAARLFVRVVVCACVCVYKCVCVCVCLCESVLCACTCVRACFWARRGKLHYAFGKGMCACHLRACLLCTNTHTCTCTKTRAHAQTHKHSTHAHTTTRTNKRAANTCVFVHVCACLRTCSLTLINTAGTNRKGRRPGDKKESEGDDNNTNNNNGTSSTAYVLFVRVLFISHESVLFVIVCMYLCVYSTFHCI